MNKFEFEMTAENAAKAVCGASMQFYAGTLFVKCNSIEAARIETALIEALKCGVIVGKVGPEFCYDFTA